MSRALSSLLIAGGGTGGHVYPAVAVAEEVLARNPEAEVLFIGSPRGLENRILPSLGYRLETISVSRLKGAGILDRLLGLIRLPVGIVQSLGHLLRMRPQVVLGVGGYASGPALLAAWLIRRPTAIHEQNAIPGLTNRVLGKLVRRVFVAFASARVHFPAGKLRVTGNPLRRDLAQALAGAELRPAPPAGSLRLLIVGGSQGARFLNEQVPGLLLSLAEAHPELQLQVVHQSGVADEPATRARYADTPLEASSVVLPYIDDMPAAYAQADLAITRAGALTVAELSAVGMPSLLVPFPFAADDHQVANARAVERAGAGRMVCQQDWRPSELVPWLADLASSPAQRQAMSRSARSLARLDAASALVDQLEEIAA